MGNCYKLYFNKYVKSKCEKKKIGENNNIVFFSIQVHPPLEFGPRTPVGEPLA